MIEALQILTEELGRISFNITSLIILAIVFVISYKVSSIFENRVFRYLIIVVSIITLSNPIHPQYHTVFFNINNWIALGGLAPHFKFLIEDIEEKYYELKYATINAYYFWLTVYYKTLKILKYMVWMIVTTWYLILWIYYGLKNFLKLIKFALLYLWELIIDQVGDTHKYSFYDYSNWFKENHQEQKQRRFWSWDREWYEGKQFYFKDAEPSENSNRSNSNQKHKQESNQQKQEKAYDEYKQNHGDSKQEDSKSYQNDQSSKQQQSHGSKYDRFFSGNYYAVLGVEKDSTFSQIKSAYMKLIKEYHPDLHPENEEEFTKIAQKINEAYEYFKKMNSNK